MTNDQDSAINDLDRITELNNTHLGAYWAKARAYHESGLTKQAIANWSMLVRLKPENADGYFQRACLYEQENVHASALGIFN